jgi:hypothetical protein
MYWQIIEDFLYYFYFAQCMHQLPIFIKNKIFSIDFKYCEQNLHFYIPVKVEKMVHRIYPKHNLSLYIKDLI